MASDEVTVSPTTVLPQETAGNDEKDITLAEQTSNLTLGGSSKNGGQADVDVISQFDPLFVHSVEKDINVTVPVQSLSPEPIPRVEHLRGPSTGATPLPISPDRTVQPEGAAPPPTTLQSLARKQSSETQDGAPQLPFDFQTFLDQMKSKSAEPVAKYLRRFVKQTSRIHDAQPEFREFSSFLTNFSRKSFSVNDQIKLIHDFLDVCCRF